MFLHAIPPERAWVKVPRALIRRTELDPAARLLIAHVSDLRPDEQQAPLSKHAETLGLTHNTYKRVKKELAEYGYLRDFREQGEGGLWFTDQWVSTVPLTEDQFTALREGTSPSTPNPTAGRPGGPRTDRSLGTTGTTKNNGKTPPTHPSQDPTRDATETAPEAPPQQATAAHPPTATPQTAGQAPAALEAAGSTEPAGPAPTAMATIPQPAPGPTPDPTQLANRARHFALAERVLRDLPATRSDLKLTPRNVRYLANALTDHLQQGTPAWEIHTALTHDLPGEPIRNPAGFVTHRLRDKLPDRTALEARATAAPATAPPTRPKPITECRGPGRPGEHHFRPTGDEVYCNPCRREHPRLAALSEAEHGGWWAPLTTPGYPEPPF
ncbi:hypothetical protein [Streptomyces sp. NPDC048442]|uniref:hypothetical protein n=1 Tax=Streptomyces sp. NPDC048442 TaxID=3154823 RepID=UPI003417F09F